jgi:hypothetical protein
VAPSTDDYRLLASAAARVNNWDHFASEAEAHGLGPLAHTNLMRAGVILPSETKQQLAGLALRHRRANRIRFRVLGEILDAFEHASIPVVVLKGAALAHLVYPSVELRPLSDIDLLVASDAAARAQTTLAALGFMAPLAPATRELAGHHHLPSATKNCDGERVAVEIHMDALTRDAPGSLTLEGLSAEPQTFSVEGRTAQALGHADMLYHLCRHVAECAHLLRLVWVADIVGYATRYRDVIPWEEMRRRYPFVPNALSLLHLVTALPSGLLEHVTPARPEGLRGVGMASRPLTEIFVRGRPFQDVLSDVFDPSDWWLRLYYALDDRASLAWCRSVRHPLHVGHWLVRRAVSYVQWRSRG